MAWIAPVVGWIGANIGTIGTVASVASTAYSAYSGREQSQEARSERHKAERAAALAQRKLDASAAEKAGLAEAERIRKRRARASTIKTSAGGLTEAPVVLKRTLGD